MNVASVWMKAVGSSTNNGSPTLITSPGNPVNRRNFANILELLGTTKQGIIELAVISEEEFALCPSCNQQGIAGPAMLQGLLTRCIDVRRVCVQCAAATRISNGSQRSHLERNSCQRNSRPIQLLLTVCFRMGLEAADS